LSALPRKAVAFLTLFSVRRGVAQGVSLPAGSDKGYSPLTSAAFLKNCCTKKLSILLRLQYLFRTSEHFKQISLLKIDFRFFVHLSMM
jgi:hypothetical protein